MGLITYLHIVDQEGVVIDDMDALNKDTEDAGVNELSDNISYNAQAYQGFYQMANGKLKIAQFGDGEFNDYADGWSSVYGCYYIDAAEVLSKHMTEGKIVLMMDIEGNGELPTP